jgi:hypothetical protein
MLVNASREDWLGAYAGVLQRDTMKALYIHNEGPVYTRVKIHSFVRNALYKYYL